MIPEIVTQLPALLPPSSICKTPTTILLSVGGGGLLAGVLTGLVSYNLKDTGVITVETAGADCFAESLRLNGRQGWKMGDKVQVVEMEAITSRAGSLGAKSPAKGAVLKALQWEKTVHRGLLTLVISDEAAIWSSFCFLGE